MKKTLVIGASSKPDRYAYQAVSLLQEKGFDVIALGNKTGMINDIQIIDNPQPFENIHTVSIYLRPQLQHQYYKYIISLKPNRIIFNPGTENFEFAQIAKENKIAVENACTLVLLRIGNY